VSGSGESSEQSSQQAWQPTAEIAALKARANALEAIRGFFRQRGVLEVSTPLLGRHTIPDPNIPSIPAQAAGESRWLQTSPEFAMKRLLAAGSGDIFQICPAFRDGERGPWHNPEFTLLEWYRQGWDDKALASEVAELIASLLSQPFARPGLADLPVERLAYREAFQRHAGVDPLMDDDEKIIESAIQIVGSGGPSDWTRADWLDLIGATRVYPALGRGAITILEDFPADQAALARLHKDDPRLAARFEVVLEGVELANGFFELGDAGEQRRRFEAECQVRQARGQVDVEADERLLSALVQGMPECSGVALGLDRLLALALGSRGIDAVMSFSWERA